MFYETDNGDLVMEFGHGDTQFRTHGNILGFKPVEPGEIGRKVNPNNYPEFPDDPRFTIVDKDDESLMYPVYIRFLEPQSVDIFIIALERVKQNLLQTQKEHKEMGRVNTDEIVTEDSFELAQKIHDLLINKEGACIKNGTMNLLAKLLDDHKRQYLSRSFVQQEKY
jgi:hypothetical protein